MENQMATTGSTQVTPTGGGRKTDYGGFKPSTPQMAKAKILHRKGMFEISEPDGTKELVTMLSDVIILSASSGRIMWDPDSAPGSGNWVCRSSDGESPDPGGRYTGPCCTPQGRPACPMAQWGNKKADPQGYKPKCSETINLVVARKNKEPFWISFDKGNLKLFKDFLTHNFFNLDIPFYARYVSIGLREEVYGQTDNAYQRLEPVLGAEPSKLVQQEAAKATRLVQGLAASNPDSFTEVVSEPIPAQAQVIEVSAQTPADRIKILINLAKETGKTLADVIKMTKAQFGQAPAQLTEGAFGLVQLALSSGVEIPELLAIGADHMDVSNPSGLSPDEVALIATLVDIPF